MKHRKVSVLWLVGAGLLVLPVALAALAATVGKTLNVQVREGKLRATPNSLGSIVGSVRYSEAVTVEEERAGWSRVAAADGKASGWLHASALTANKIELTEEGDAPDVGVSSDEMANAGRGFSEDVEAKFRENNPDIDFSWVEKMEKWSVPPEECVAFLKEGGVTPPTGGAQ